MLINLLIFISRVLIRNVSLFELSLKCRPREAHKPSNTSISSIACSSNSKLLIALAFSSFFSFDKKISMIFCYLEKQRIGYKIQHNTDYQKGEYLCIGWHSLVEQVEHVGCLTKAKGERSTTAPPQTLVLTHNRPLQTEHHLCGAQRRSDASVFHLFCSKTCGKVERFPDFHAQDIFAML